MRRALACAIVCGAAARASASPGPYTVAADAIAWRAPDACGDAAELRRRVGGYLDREPPPGPLASIAIARDDDGVFHARLTIGASERTLDGADCAQVVDAAALVIALAVQANDAAESVHEIAAPPPPPPLARHLSVRVRGALDAGSSPDGGAGLDGGVVLTSGRLAVIASARWFPARFAAVEGSASAGVDVALAGGAAEACMQAAGVWACVGGEAAEMSGAGTGLVGARTTRSLWSAITAGVAAELPLGDRARLVGELGGYFATKRPRFVLDDGSVLYEPSLVGARAYAGVEVTLF